MDKTKIDWADMSWNPVTGCLHGCEFCYARRIAERFGGASETISNESIGTECQWATEDTGEIHELEAPIYDIDRGYFAPYPYYFDPTFHRYRLGEPVRKTRPRNIFVCSMADLFGEWVPDEWIKAVFKACEAAPQHRYLFLTKNPTRYLKTGILWGKNYWFGATVTGGEGEINRHTIEGPNTFVSLEPLQGIPVNFEKWIKNIRWAIIGAETGKRKGKIILRREWIESIVAECRKSNVPVFLKSNLRGVWGDELIQEYPWDNE